MAARVPTILVVDDSSEARDTYLDLLGDAGFEVSGAEDGTAALAAIDRRAPDLVILDMQMPQMGGLELLERVRARRATAPPFVCVSGLEALEHAALARGARAFLRKPVVGADLLAVIDAALAGVTCPFTPGTWLPTAECSRASAVLPESSCP